MRAEEHREMGAAGHPGEAVRTARELAHAHCAEESTGGDWCAYSGKYLAQRPHSFACDRLTAAIEGRDREVVEACERVIGKLPVVGIAVAPYIAALVAARRAVLALSPKGTTPRGDE